MMWVGPEKVGSLQFIMKSLENDYWPVELGIRCSTGRPEHPERLWLQVGWWWYCW